MKSYSDYRAEARAALQGQWNNAALAVFVVFVIAGLFSAGSTISGDNLFLKSSLGGLEVVVSILLFMPLQFGLFAGLLSLSRAASSETTFGEAPVAPFESMVANFKKDYSRYVQAGFLSLLAEIGLGIVTLFIGTIILSYAYAMIPFLLNDYPELTPKEACRTSREMMRGHKWDLFVLDLTFIGWYLLAFLSLGIGMLWLSPYVNTARARFYDDLKSSVIVED